jgi:hypothetical protein
VELVAIAEATSGVLEVAIRSIQVEMATLTLEEEAGAGALVGAAEIIVAVEALMVDPGLVTGVAIGTSPETGTETGAGTGIGTESVVERTTEAGLWEGRGSVMTLPVAGTEDSSRNPV